MKIKLLTGRVGMGFVQEPGDIIDLPKHEARAMIASGQAEAVDGQQPIEAATEQSPEPAAGTPQTENTTQPQPLESAARRTRPPRGR